jgi:hypothetical protein
MKLAPRMDPENFLDSKYSILTEILLRLQISMPRKTIDPSHMVGLCLLALTS